MKKQFLLENNENYFCIKLPLKRLTAFSVLNQTLITTKAFTQKDTY